MKNIKVLNKTLLDLLEDLEYKNPNLSITIDKILNLLDEYCLTLSNLN